jgi:DedD protein
MDRRVKERLIGASILVALVVLVVPELLSGPKPNTATAPTLPAAAPEPVRNVTVDLTTSKAPANTDIESAIPQAASPAASSAASSAAASAAGSAADSPAAEIPAATSPAPSGAVASASAPTSTAPVKSFAKPAATRPALLESAAHSPTSAAHGSWSVQLGSFASRANADNLTRQVKGQGFSAFVLTGGSGTSVRYRVRVGPLADRESAERMAAKLKSVGHVGSVVSPTA